MDPCHHNVPIDIHAICEGLDHNINVPTNNKSSTTLKNQCDPKLVSNTLAFNKYISKNTN